MSPAPNEPRPGLSPPIYVPERIDPDLRPPVGSITFGESHRAAAIPRWFLLLSLIIGNAMLSRYMSEVKLLGVLEFLSMLAITAYSVIKRRPDVSLCVLMFIPGAEIVWRQSNAPIPYLAGPYLVIGISLLVTFTSFGAINRSGRTAIFYFLLLLPSSLVTLTSATESARQAIFFALNGPATLAAVVILLSQVEIEPWFYRRLLWVLLISGIGPLAVALTAINDYIVNTGSLQFSDSSNFVTSGGFGPVQVSSVMGLTALVGVLLFLVEGETVPRVMVVIITITATTQSFLTFSRGGMFATAFALAGLAVSQAGDRESRRRVIMVVLVAFGVGYFLVIPRVDAFTGGKFSERFSSTRSGRSGLASNDLQIFAKHMAFGVGPGMSKYQRLGYDVCHLRGDTCASEGSSHTEFTRMLSEHGLSGLLDIGMIILLVSQAVRRAGRSLPITITFMTWAVAQMFYANLRVVAIPIALAGSMSWPGWSPTYMAAFGETPSESQARM